MENGDKRRKINDFNPISQELGTASPKIDFLTVFEESRPNFWLCRFFGSSVLKISDARNWREMWHSKNQSKAQLFILCFTLIFSTFFEASIFGSFAANNHIANPQTRPAAAYGQTALSSLAAAAGFIPIEIVADRLNIR